MAAAAQDGIRASTGPRPIGRGNLAINKQNNHTRLCFNGAAPNRARKYPAAGVRQQLVAYASTGPRPIGRGNRRWRSLALRPRTSFNGAAPNRARKSAFCYSFCHRCAILELRPPPIFYCVHGRSIFGSCHYSLVVRQLHYASDGGVSRVTPPLADSIVKELGKFKPRSRARPISGTEDPRP